METNLDSTIFGQLAIKYGLLTEEQVREAMIEAREETGQPVPDLMAYIRILERKSLITSFQTSKIMKGDSEGYNLGVYRLLYKISSGSFGRVYRAVDPGSQRIVAIKVLRRRWSEDQAKIDLFMREGRVGLSLKHPNIVEVTDIRQDPITKQYYLVMEFIEGGNLREVLQGRKTLSVAESLRLLEDCTNGLVYAFSRGITHRDIKPTNVLVSSLGEAKLTDFGLAQTFAKMTNVEEHVDRTVDYAGLERTTNVKMNDVRSDIYFLGAVFSECLTGKQPLETTRDRHQRMSKRRFDEVQYAKPGDLEAPPSVFQLVETMMSLIPTSRYQTPSQLLDAVKAARRDLERGAGKSVAAGPQSLFVAESDDRLQEALREKFKELGFRVFMASDPVRALDRFRQQPYDALIVDIGTTGEEGMLVFEQVLRDAKAKGITLAAIAILSEEQAEWRKKITRGPRVQAMVRPVGLKQLHRTLTALLKAEG
jgi:eukaryotic-like serine/threonine-protein kinase